MASDAEQRPSDTEQRPVFSIFWPRFGEYLDRAGALQHRGELVSGLGGRVLELGCGDGRLFPHYRPAVEHVLAVEPEPRLRARAIEDAIHAPVPIDVVDGRDDQLPADDASVDAAVCSLVLCTVPDQAAALAELHRVVRPGGELRFYEHILDDHAPIRATGQRLLDRTGIWPLVGAGCHVSRPTTEAIEAAGFAVERLHRFPFPGRVIGVPHVLGVARRR